MTNVKRGFAVLLVGVLAANASSAQAPTTVTAADEAAIQAALATALDEILRMEPQALATVKRLVQACATESDIAVLDDAAQSLVGLLRRPQAGQGMKAFLGKSPPPWAPATRKAAE